MLFALIDMDPRRNVLMLALVAIAMQSLNSDPVRADYCSFKTQEPDPPIVLARVKRAVTSSDICTIASFKAYLQIDEDKYLEYDGFSGDCPSSENDNQVSFTMRFNDDCAALTLSFARLDKRSPWKIASIILQIFQDAPIVMEKILPEYGPENPAREFGHAFGCKSKQTIVLSDGPHGVGSVKLVLSDVRIEAFRNETEPGFYQPQDPCRRDGGSSLAIIIGSSITVAIILLIAGAVYYVYRYGNCQGEE